MTDKKSSVGLEQDKGAAIAAILYLMFMLGFFSWLLFDTWIDAHTLARVVGYDLAPLRTPWFHMMAYTIIGGAIGGIVNGIRSFLVHYSAFNRVYFWKYITAPWMGAALALIAFALLQSTVAIFGGKPRMSVPSRPSSWQILALAYWPAMGRKTCLPGLTKKYPLYSR